MHRKQSYYSAIYTQSIILLSIDCHLRICTSLNTDVFPPPSLLSSFLNIFHGIQFYLLFQELSFISSFRSYLISFILQKPFLPFIHQPLSCIALPLIALFTSPLLLLVISSLMQFFLCDSHHFYRCICVNSAKTI